VSSAGIEAAAAQILTQSGAGFSHPARSAGQTSRVRSAVHPGNSLQATRTQRALGRIRVGGAAGNGAEAGAVVTGLRSTTVAGGCDAGGGGGLAHEPSNPRIAAPHTWRRGAKDILMWLILLEALAALAILVGIVWWTMFSGRRRGERREDD
jgi:hypothetical protein